MPLGEPNFGRLATKAQAQHWVAGAILTQCSMGLDLAKYVVGLNCAMLHLRAASRAHTEHISWIVGPASMGIRYQIQPLIRERTRGAVVDRWVSLQGERYEGCSEIRRREDG